MLVQEEYKEDGGEGGIASTGGTQGGRWRGSCPICQVKFRGNRYQEHRGRQLDVISSFFLSHICSPVEVISRPLFLSTVIKNSGNFLLNKEK